jgi:hypothetical protein
VEPEEVKIAGVSDALKEKVLRSLDQYTLGFLRLENTPHGPDVSLLGSGILVSIGKVSAILTAHHVVEVLPPTGRVGVMLSPTTYPETLDVSGLAYVKIARGDVDSQGPDLGAVILAPPLAGALAAKKVFYNLELQRERLLHSPPDLCDGMWFVHGMPDENTVERPDTATGRGIVKTFFKFGGIGKPESLIRIGEHDYFTIPIAPSAPPPVPKEFGGMSGGGLWQIPLVRRESAELDHARPLLSGLAFYQHPVTRAGSALRCHGRASLYGVAYDAIVRIRH